MLDPVTTAVLRAVLDEVCEHASCRDTGARAHVASKSWKPLLEARRRANV